VRPNNPATAVLILSAEGTVLATSGPATMVGEPAGGSDRADVTASFRAERGEDLSALVRDVANADRPGPLMARVFSEGSAEPMLLTLHHVAAGLVVGVVSDCRDSTPGPDHAISALRQVWDGLAEGVAVVSRDPQGRLDKITECNGAFASMFGLGSDDVVGQSLARFLAPLNAASFDRRVAEEVVGEGRSLADLTLARRALLDWELAPVRAQDGRVSGLVAVVRNASHAHRAILWKRADLDPSSGLPNQVHFMSRLERSVERAAQARAYTFAVIGLEMRGLRAVERRLGAQAANAALEALVRRLEQRLRPTDLVARTGDRRLAILLDQFAPWGALPDVVERLRLVTDAPYTIAGERMTMSAIGAPGPIWRGDGPPVGAQEVMGHLDAAVAQAKTDGPTPDARAIARTSANLTDLSNAVQKARLSLRYLPVVSPADGRIEGLEALVRWPHPEHGLITGGAFLRQAEHHGLTGPIAEWVWAEALRNLKDWDASLPPGRVPPMHINLSLSEFWHPDLVGDLERRAARAAVSPARIRVEVPEAAVARRSDSAKTILEDLARSGFEPWIDRFGAGGIPLRELDSLPIRHAKLDSVLAWRTNGGPARPLEPRAALGSLLSLGHDLEWSISVGGVETGEQADALRALDCDLAQGFFFHGPMDASQAAALMRQSTAQETRSDPI
jgi:PAS domain S-box-containing protein